MSTLTASPSPAVSPRTSAYPHFPVPLSRKTSQPQAPLYLNSASPASRPLSTPKAPEQSPHYSPHLRPAPRPTVRPQYADAGVQCALEGSFTVARNYTIPGGPSPLIKRKEPSSSPVMRATTQTSGLPASPPSKPHPRDTPYKGGNGAHTTDQSQPQDVPTQDTASEPNPMSATSAAKRLRTGAKTTKYMPRKYETCNPKDLGVLIANMLMELIRLNDNIPLKDGKLTRFHSRYVALRIACSRVGLRYNCG